MADNFFDHLQAIRDRNVPFAIATVVEGAGSVSAKLGSKALIDANGHIVFGWVGGGCAESSACQAGVDAIADGECRMLDIDLDDEVLGAGMPCGGHMRVFVEPHLMEPTLWIMGHGAVAEHLCHFADVLGFSVVVNDPQASREKFPDARELIVDDTILYEKLTPAPEDFVVIATQHKGDHQSMTQAINSKARYIALIASRKRAGLVMDYLVQSGHTAESLNRVMAPCGLDIGGRTPAEIALSVLSEIVMVRRNGSGERKRNQVARLEAV